MKKIKFRVVVLFVLFFTKSSANTIYEYSVGFYSDTSQRNEKDVNIDSVAMTDSISIFNLLTLDKDKLYIVRLYKYNELNIESDKKKVKLLIENSCKKIPKGCHIIFIWYDSYVNRNTFDKGCYYNNVLKISSQNFQEYLDGFNKLGKKELINKIRKQGYLILKYGKEKLYYGLG